MGEDLVKDSLTFLNNKNMFEDMLETKYANLEKCGVLYFDLNHLRHINATYGREAGDKAIVMVADSVRRLQEDDVHVYRYGDDSFLVIGIDYSKEQTRSLMEAWIERWKELSVHLGNENVLSVGMAWDSSPVSLKELIAKASEEMLHNRKLLEEGIPMEFCVRGELSSSFGLNTRKQFSKMIEYKLRNDEGEYCLIAIDIEHFKIFNKWRGRNAGDEFLMAMASALRQFEKEYGGVAAYFGGDNFAVFLPNRPEVIALLEQRLVAVALEKGKTVGFLPAFGVYCIDNRELETVEMYDYAVEALSKVVGRYEKRICYYEKSMTSAAEKEVDIIVAAREALEKGEFVIYLQPKVRITTKKIVGAEALVRWISPEKGMISPADFIPVLEKNGFIGELDQCVWELVCKTIRSWSDRGIEPVPVSINVSRIDILSFDTVKFLNSLVEKYQIERKYLKIEITESAYADNAGKILDTIQELRESGYTLMMDDFGSGYSSLNMLRQAIVDIIKLDMRFLDIDHGDIQKGFSILKSVINMSNEISIPIVIEGVETNQQADFLQDMGVRFAQGYLYYRPMPVEQFEQLIAQDENIDRRGIYNKNIDVEHFDKTITRMLENRNTRYEKIGITKTRGGFFKYEAVGAQKLLEVSQSVAYMFGCDTVEEFREYVGNSFIGMVHPEDRERVEYEINTQIFDSEWKMDYIEYRILRKDGEVRYIYDYGHLEEKKAGEKPCFYVFLLDVTDRIM
uniref:EAL domain-containing protein n=1 Tax=Acetatifactor sp. TaxID=1872090 RepID=UPI0040559C8A